jgi:calcium-dependent protein kinase
MLSSHPNVAAMVATYEDASSVHLVLELCEGGQLFDAVCAGGHISERAAARYFRKMVEVVHHCHTLGIAHRDIKPENFLLSRTGAGAEVKAADFGLSQFFRPGRSFHSLVGSAYYVAPEVLARDYGPKADIWSLGVCLYILLSGRPPFWGDTEEEIFAMVKHAEVDYASDPWPGLSRAAREVVRAMLNRDEARRPSAAQLLQHAWLCQAAPDSDLGAGVIQRMKAFAAMTRVKRAAVLVATQGLSEGAVPEDIPAMFAALDADGNGELSAEEVRVGLARAGVDVSDEEVQQLMHASKPEGGGGGGGAAVTLPRFVAATLGHSLARRDEFSRRLFNQFDEAGAGAIPAGELPAVLARHGLSEAEAEAAAEAMGAGARGAVGAAQFQKWLGGAADSLQEAVRRRYKEEDSPRALDGPGL